MDQKNCQRLDDRTVRLYNGRKTEGNAASTPLTITKEEEEEDDLLISKRKPMILSLLSPLSKNILMQGVHMM